MRNESIPLSYRERTDGIEVSVEPSFLPEHSDPDRGVFAFSYKIRMQNCGAETVQLTRRYCLVVSGRDPYAEIEGDGVIGERPVLAPNESFEYLSGSVIRHPTGSISGSYTFVNQSGRSVEVKIPEFDLVYPGFLH